jgi:hypothetical protein
MGSRFRGNDDKLEQSEIRNDHIKGEGFLSPKASRVAEIAVPQRFSWWNPVKRRW